MMPTTLSEYVREKINDPDVHDAGWFPKGILLKKGGVVHVEDADNLGYTLCGRDLIEGQLRMGPALVMLRRSKGCQECEKAT